MEMNYIKLWNELADDIRLTRKNGGDMSGLAERGLSLCNSNARQWGEAKNDGGVTTAILRRCQHRTCQIMFPDQDFSNDDKLLEEAEQASLNLELYKEKLRKEGVTGL